MAERFGYAASFLALGLVALVALALWIAARPWTDQRAGQDQAGAS